MKLPGFLILGSLLLGAFESPSRADEKPSPLINLIPVIQKRLAADYPRLDALYMDLHAHPELALHEERTAAVLARQLRDAGLEVTEKVGGFGVVGLLKNGPGPTVLIRADMDGLPLIEKTGLSYASKVRTRDAEGREVGVMHACGHDVNVT